MRETPFSRGAVPLLAVLAIACGESSTGPTDPDPVEPPEPPPVAAQIVPCVGGQADGFRAMASTSWPTCRWAT